ncbi:MAG: transcription elongation factor GreA [Tissierellia bacterium]|nr:transcription elongation factor GreA [Tissierellia bacterium]
MVEKDVFYTKEGLLKAEEELDYLKSVRRREVAERIKTALDYGDLSENAEYDQAKNEQAQLEEKIAKQEMMLRNAKVIDEDELSTDIVNVGSTVKVMNLEYKEEEEFTIVGSAEADPFNGKISNESPVGSALIGKNLNEVVDVEVPSGVIKYEILSIA